MKARFARPVEILSGDDGYRRVAGFEAIGLFDWLILFPLFIVIATQLEESATIRVRVALHSLSARWRR